MYRTTPVITLHLESQISPIFTNIEFKIIKYFYKIQCSNKTHILHSLFTSHENLVDGLDWSVLPHKSPFRIRAKHTCIKYDIREEVIEENSTNRFFSPPWFPFDEFFSTSFDSFTKNSDNQIMASCIYNNLVQVKYSGVSRCFSDGSKTQEGVSAAVYMEEENISLSWRLKNKHSIIIAELYAIYRCLLYRSRNSLSNFVIFTDSLSSILLLHDQYGKSNWKLTSKIKRVLVELYSTGIKQ